ncbi:hypothetical protein INT45_003193 [Circinella minor]|uniref:Uncharacterized protein n=1 Tax=Circinella minor TaxID=1195481 RepID=A0A8H7VER9_9FUNG|nr:hypothetical protein INT45_003193 [Circinella minor]
MNRRAFELANEIKYGEVKKVVTKMINKLYFDIEDDLSTECLPGRCVIVAYIIQEAGLRLKSSYDIDEIMNDYSNTPADVFGYCANAHSRNDFQELFLSTEDKEKVIKKAGKITEEKKMKALGTIVLYLLVHSWYPSSIFSRTTNTFPDSIFGPVDEAPILRGDSDSITRSTSEGISEMERDGTVVRNGDNIIEYIIISDE